MDTENETFDMQLNLLYKQQCSMSQHCLGNG